MQASHLSKLWSFLRGRPALSRAPVSVSPGRRSLEKYESSKLVNHRLSAVRDEALLEDQRGNVREADARQGAVSTSYGLPEDFNEHFDLGRVLGQGGNAIVVRAVSRHSGKEFACKCIRKVSSMLSLFSQLLHMLLDPCWNAHRVACLPAPNILMLSHHTPSFPQTAY